MTDEIPQEVVGAPMAAQLSGPAPDADPSIPGASEASQGSAEAIEAGEPVPFATIPERTPLQTTIPVELRNGDQSSFSTPRPDLNGIDRAKQVAAEDQERQLAVSATLNANRQAYAEAFAKTDQGQQHKQIKAAEAAMRDTGTATQEGHDWLDIDPNAPMRVV